MEFSLKEISRTVERIIPGEKFDKNTPFIPDDFATQHFLLKAG